MTSNMHFGSHPLFAGRPPLPLIPVGPAQQRAFDASLDTVESTLYDLIEFIEDRGEEEIVAAIATLRARLHSGSVEAAALTRLSRTVGQVRAWSAEMDLALRSIASQLPGTAFDAGSGCPVG